MTARKPLHLTNDGADAADARRFIGRITGNRTGVVGPAAMKVTQTATPSMAVEVAVGDAVIVGTSASDQGSYAVENDAVVSKSLSASDPSNPRIDLVVGHIRDSDYVALEPDTFELRIIEGVAAPSPSAPAAPPNSDIYGQVLVPAAATQIVDADITDPRTILEPSTRRDFAAIYRNDVGLDIWGTFTESPTGTFRATAANLNSFSNTDGMVDVADTITVQTAGLWRLTAKAHIDGNADTRARLGVDVDGGPANYIFQHISPVSVNPETIGGEILVSAAVGDALTLFLIIENTAGAVSAQEVNAHMTAELINPT